MTAGSDVRRYFDGIDAIGSVEAHTSGSNIEVRIGLRRFDRPARRAVAEAQKRMYRELPAYTFDVVVVDESVTAHPDPSAAASTLPPTRR